MKHAPACMIGQVHLLNKSKFVGNIATYQDSHAIVSCKAKKKQAVASYSYSLMSPSVIYSILGSCMHQYGKYNIHARKFNISQ